MLYKDAPGLSRSKAKMSGEMSSLAAAKQNHRLSFDVCIERRVTDGNPTVYCKLNHYGIYSLATGPGQSTLPEETTNIAEFANKVKDLIISAGAAV
jgi:hypothetical protein